MINLLRAEAARLLSRRFAAVALLIVLLGIGAWQIQVYFELSPPGAAELAQAQSSFDESHQDWVDHHLEYEKECVDGGQPANECTIPEPTLNDYLYQGTFREVATSSVTLTSYVVALAVFMIAGSYIGAEYSSGSIANWLSFVPRRRAVYAAKLITVVLFAAAVAFVFQALTVGFALSVASSYDQPTDGLDKVADLAARGLLLPVLLGVLGACIGFLARHTAAAIGFLLGYLVLWFVRNGPLAEVAWAQRLTPWVPEANLAALLNNGHTYAIPVVTVTPEGKSFDEIEKHLSLAHGAVYWAVLIVVVVLATGLVFRRRDVS